MTTLIDRIMKEISLTGFVVRAKDGQDKRLAEKMNQFIKEDIPNYIRKILEKHILEAELTAVKGVDELVEKRTKAEGVVAKSGYILVDEFISDLKSLKQTPVASGKQFIGNFKGEEMRLIGDSEIHKEFIKHINLLHKNDIEKPTTEEIIKDSQPKDVEIEHTCDWEETNIVRCRICGALSE